MELKEIPHIISPVNKPLAQMGWLVTEHETVDKITLEAFDDDKTDKMATSLLNKGFYLKSKELGPHFSDISSSWYNFSSLWESLSTDQYMQDNGKYRKRSYSTMHYQGNNKVALKPYMPLYKSSLYNNFAGDIYRYFDKTDPILYKNKYFKKALTLATHVFNECAKRKGNEHPEWFIEVDQYRVVADTDTHGKPTPEGIHSDGTSYFLLMLVDRQNIEGGVSRIYDGNEELLHETTLTYPGDMMLLNDLDMLHGVSDISSKMDYANRDILHISFTDLTAKSAIQRRFGLTDDEIQLVDNLREK